MLRLHLEARQLRIRGEQAVKENQRKSFNLEALLAIECEEGDRRDVKPDAGSATATNENSVRFCAGSEDPAAKIRELAEGGYIERNEPVVLIGECGTGYDRRNVICSRSLLAMTSIGGKPGK